MSTVPNKVIYSMIGVSKYYDKKAVLKDIYLSYFYGAKIGVIGLNGSGKSSLLRILSGVDQDFQGEASFVPETFENASLKLTINANSLCVVNDVKEKDRQDIERTMRDEVLETGKFPEIVFQSNNVSLSRIGEGRYRARVIGDLTLHGVTQSNISLNGEVTLNNDGLKTKGDFVIKQTDYKIKLVSVAGGTLKIKNEVKGRFDILARNA